jgi:hypothetical protein
VISGHLVRLDALIAFYGSDSDSEEPDDRLITASDDREQDLQAGSPQVLPRQVTQSVINQAQKGSITFKEYVSAVRRNDSVHERSSKAEAMLMSTNASSQNGTVA